MNYSDERYRKLVARTEEARKKLSSNLWMCIDAKLNKAADKGLDFCVIGFKSIGAESTSSDYCYYDHKEIDPTILEALIEIGKGPITVSRLSDDPHKFNFCWKQDK